MNILLTTGIYPPAVGGPAYYAQELRTAFETLGHTVTVRTYGIENYLPTGIRHIVFFLRIVPDLFRVDVTIALDTYSIGFPSVFGCWLFRKKVLIRTGGDFLWESYTQRTGEKVLLSEFYNYKRDFTIKEHIIYLVTKWTLHHTTKLIFSTAYQRDIFIGAYNLKKEKTDIIENYYGHKQKNTPAKKKNFLCFTRNLKWKNIDILQKAFTKAQQKNPDITLETGTIPRAQLLHKLSECYAVILISLGDISPNFILEALSFNRPVILTAENGISNRLDDAVLYVDPLDENGIAEKILHLSNPENYEKQKKKAAAFTFTHSYREIAEEFVNTYKEL